MDLQAELSAITKALSTVRIPAVLTEPMMHQMIGDALKQAGIEAIHEAKLAPRCRVDFLVDTIGIEAKVGRQPKGKLLAQAEKYLALPSLSALILVTSGGVNLPGSIHGKPLIVFGLNKLWGVSLP